MSICPSGNARQDTVIQESSHPVRDAVELYNEAIHEWDACLTNGEEIPKEVVTAQQEAEVVELPKRKA